jgi:4-amino-4-deoxychorismate lyase
VIQFLETLRIQNGTPCQLDWHQKRVDATLTRFYGDISVEEQSLQLAEILSSCELPKDGIWRCRIIYDLHSASVEFIPDGQAGFRSLRMIEVPIEFDYLYKYADRSFLQDLFAKRDGADDVLMLRKGWIADTTKANIAFRAGDRWYTPSVPFLAGTTWKRLVSRGVIIPRPIHKNDIVRYDAFKVINALNDWDGEEYLVKGILG